MQRGSVFFYTSAMVILCCLVPLEGWAQEPSSSEVDVIVEVEATAPEEADVIDEVEATPPDEADVTPAAGAEDHRITVLHNPVPQAPAGRALTIGAKVENDWTATGIWVGFRPIGSNTPYEEMELRRDSRNLHSVIIPAHRTEHPGLEYYLASRNRAGEVQYHFALPESPQPVLFEGETQGHLEQQRLARHGGRRTALRVSGDHMNFGSWLEANNRRGEAVDGRETDRYSENFWHLEMEYLYRQARTLYDIHFGIGFMRGSHGTFEDGAVPVAPGKPGTNYGYGGLTLELASAFSVQGRLAFGASAKGFTMGIGGLLRVGQIGGTNLEVGYDVIGDVGGRTRVHFSWDTVPRVPMGLGIEITQWPDFEVNPRGSRLYYEVGLNLNHALILTGRMGYVNRSNGINGGYTAGLQTVYQF